MAADHCTHRYTSSVSRYTLCTRPITERQCDGSQVGEDRRDEARESTTGWDERVVDTKPGTLQPTVQQDGQW